MHNLRFLLKVSRPRFWIYILGPYLIGLAAGVVTKQDFLRLDVIIFGLFFLFPANLLIYGINDIFDFASDRLNPKKAEYEMLVRPENHRSLAIWITALNVPFIIAAFLFAPRALPSLAGFLFFSIGYSSPPIRAKVSPIVDSVFNVLYIFPGAFAYQMLTGSFPPVGVMFAGGLWAMAMHAFSAIPDIKADQEAGFSTVATMLGHWGTHMFCMACYIGAGLASITFEPLLMLITFVYVVLIRFSSYSDISDGDLSIYRFFPYLNAASGFLLFWYVAWRKFI